MSSMEDIEFSNNPDPRCPVVLVLDCSSSMAQSVDGEKTTPLDELNAGLDVLISELHKDPLAKRRVEVSVVPFGSTVDEPTPFNTVENLQLPLLEPMGLTSIGAALNKGLDAIEDRKKVYKENGITYMRPWVMLITDGLPTDDISEVSKRVKEGEQNKKFSFFPVGVEGADMEVLSSIGTKPGLKLKGLNFSELFVWLSASQSVVSASAPGDKVNLPAPSSWLEMEV